MTARLPHAYRAAGCPQCGAREFNVTGKSDDGHTYSIFCVSCGCSSKVDRTHLPLRVHLPDWDYSALAMIAAAVVVVTALVVLMLPENAMAPLS